MLLVAILLRSTCAHMGPHCLLSMALPTCIASKASVHHLCSLYDAWPGAPGGAGRTRDTGWGALGWSRAGHSVG
jgi:hypothetical protein